MLLGEFRILRKVTSNNVMSVRPSSWNNSDPTRQIFVKFDIEGLSKMCI